MKQQRGWRRHDGVRVYYTLFVRTLLMRMKFDLMDPFSSLSISHRVHRFLVESKYVVECFSLADRQTDGHRGEDRQTL